jgi:hypothetical protein
VTQPVLLIDERAVKQAVRAARALPKELRAELRMSMNREVAAPAAREVQAVAARSPYKVVRAFRNRGVSVKPGEEPTLVFGGPETYAGRARMRTVVHGAEHGGGKRRTTYQRRGARRGRRRGESHTVHNRRTTVQFGPPSRTGRFIGPTLQAQAPVMQAAFLRVLERATDQLWGR